MRDAPGGRYDVRLEAADRGRRLDRVLSEKLADQPGLSRTRLQGLIAAGAVLVDGRPERAAALKLGSQTHVEVRVPAATPAMLRPQARPLVVVFEDDHLLILDKPAGLVVHPAAGHEDGTLVNALLAHCGASLSGIGGIRRPGIVHRLDKDTTGLMVVAKTDQAHQGLAALFADHGRTLHLERRYLALVWGRPGTAVGVVEAPIGRHQHQRDRMTVVPPPRGRVAVTHWRMAEAFEGASLVACRLETGRTHQIRVHLTSIGHPPIGDPVYGTGYRTKAARLPGPACLAARAFPRQALHAASLGFDHPATGERLSFASPLPDDMAGLRHALGATGEPPAP